MRHIEPLPVEQVAGRRIVMLEPRRLAARAAARRMAFTLGERVGDTVGYRVRHQSVAGPETRVLVVTEGVRVVVDAGLSRVPRILSPNRDEPAGDRPGAPGICYRLWSVQEDAALPERSTPEILEADLVPLALDLAAAGVRDPVELRWLDPRPGLPSPRHGLCSSNSAPSIAPEGPPLLGRPWPGLGFIPGSPTWS